VLLAGESPDGPLSASVLPIIVMLSVFAFTTGAAGVVPAFEPPHAGAETATTSTMSPTGSIFRGLRVLKSTRFTVITLSGWGRPVLPRSGTVARRCARVFH